jgi:hypothetical protein
MGVKHILDKIRQPKEEKKEYFFALQLDEGLVKSAVWTVQKGVVKTLSFGDSQSWESPDELLEVVDISLSSATQNLSLISEEVEEPNKVIFGLVNGWVEEAKIVPDKMELLKKISKKLELNPIGFVITTEAIVYHLKTIEGIPPTAILVGLGKGKLTVTLVKLGKIIETEVVKRSDNLGADLTEALSRFGQTNVFPPRILLYNSSSTEELEKAKQELMSWTWQEGTVEFLHLPKVEILAEDFDIKAVALAGGREVAKAEGIQVSPVEEKEPFPVEEKKEPPPKTEELKGAEMMGFVQGRDITKEKPLPLPQAKVPEISEAFPKLTPRLKKINFGVFKELLRGNKLWLFLRAPRTHRAYLIGGIVVAGLLILGGVLMAFLWYIPKAEITLLVKPQVLEKDFTIRLDPSATQPDKQNLILPAEQVKAITEGEKSTQTTGTKTVGDPARGEVTIYNRTDKQKTFPAGTEATGPEGLKFSLDEETTVSSESAGPDYTKIPGKATVKVTALKIGPEGNLASGTEFTLANFAKSDYIAKNDSAFTGGTSREVQVVSKEDQEKLLSQLNEELKTKAISELSGKVSLPKKIIAESLTSKIVEKNFNHNLEEESSEVKLDLKVEFAVLSYSEDELKGIIEQEVKKAVPSGFEYKPQVSETSFSLRQVTQQGVAIFTFHLKTKLIPQLNLGQIAKDLAGKYPALAQQYLDNLANVEASEIKLRPRLPSRLATLPRLAKNIKIEIKVE